MMNETPLRRQRILFSVLFLMGANLLLGGSYRALQDSWISLLIAVGILLLWGAVLARLSVLCPGKDIADLLSMFPSPVKKILEILLAVYCFGQAAVTVRTYAGFARVVSLPNTDLFYLLALFSLASVYFLRRDRVYLLRFSYGVVIPIVFIIVLIFVLLLPLFRGELLYPILYDNVENIAVCSAENLSFPFGNAFLLLGILTEPKEKGKTYASWFLGCGLAGILSLLIMMQNLLLLGGRLAENLNFPYNFSTSLVNVSDFFSRLEVFASLFFFLSAVVRSSYCLKLTQKLIANLCSAEERGLGFPLAFLLCGYCLVMYDNTNAVFGFLEIFPIIAMPIQFILPSILWLCAELRARRRDGGEFSRRDFSKRQKSLQK